jgi:hypothetical protein
VNKLWVGGGQSPYFRFEFRAADQYQNKTGIGQCLHRVHQGYWLLFVLKFTGEQEHALIRRYTQLLLPMRSLSFVHIRRLSKATDIGGMRA